MQDEFEDELNLAGACYITLKIALKIIGLMLEWEL
jgi:hypothetical protein